MLTAMYRTVLRYLSAMVRPLAVGLYQTGVAVSGAPTQPYPIEEPHRDGRPLTPAEQVAWTALAARLGGGDARRAGTPM